MENKASIEQLQSLMQKMNDKSFKLYFFVIDTKGNPIASVANIYEHVKVLNNLGYNANILVEKSDYKLNGDENGMGISDWLGEEYAQLPHAYIDKSNLNIEPSDFIIIPEVFSSIMDQIKTFPCRKIVFVQNYSAMLELLPIGKRWDFDYGFTHMIATSDKLANYARSMFPTMRSYTVPISIPSYFKNSDKPKKPIVTILTRNPSDAAAIAKSFYLQYPIYKWVTFKELRGLSRKALAKELAESCLAVWVDDSSSLGTFPLEAIHSSTPVIGRVPNMIPEWMEENNNNEVSIKLNGAWTNTTTTIPETIATFLKSWFEDNLPNDLYVEMEKTSQMYTEEKQATVIKAVYEHLFNERLAEFQNALNEITREENKQ